MTGSTKVIKVSEKTSASFRGQMLLWYDKHRRTIPWRAEKGEISNPYHVWLSEIMCQQTTVPAVIPYFLKFIKKWPQVENLANAEREDVMREWAGLGYYARARNLYKCAQIIANDYGGQFPANKTDLLCLPGIGDYTSAAIAAIAFNKPETVVDGNIERVMARQFNIKTPMSMAKKEIKQVAAGFFERELERPGDFAQSLMDLGSAICTPKNPKCMLCPVRSTCEAYKKGNMEDLPVKAPKKIKPQRYGYIYWITNSKEQVLIHTRDDKELLGGMEALPTTEWISDITSLQIPDFIKDQPLSDTGQVVKHSFTHFDLTLSLCQVNALTFANILPDGYKWVCESEIEPFNFPTVFKKAVVLFLKS